MTIKKSTYQSLRNRIITSSLSPGQRLYEKELMQAYQIGRTPLREIFLQLQEEGLIEIIPQVGTQVATIEIMEIRDVIEVRRWLEQLVGQLAADKITPGQIVQLKTIIREVEALDRQNKATIDTLNHFDTQFHTILYQATQNKTLQEMLPKLLIKITRFWYYIGFQLTEFLHHFDDLKEVIVALENRDAARVQKALNVHLDHFVEKVKAQIL
ncbi:MAG: GntR family transcriptional regulator [Desulfobacterales bacterium]|nr:GntR family transcriptional regulator [Desulfobacterales bacterium]